MTLRSRLDRVEKLVPEPVRSGCGRCDSVPWLASLIIFEGPGREPARKCPECGRPVSMAGSPSARVILVRPGVQDPPEMP